jgi:hypothetical protein
MTQAFANFEALSAFYREQIEVPGFDTAFTEQGSMAQLSVHDEPVATDMPDPQAARGAMEMVIGTVFDLFRGTRMEEFGQDIVWGIVNSFHVTSQRIEKRRTKPPGSWATWPAPLTLRKSTPSNWRKPSASPRR